MSPSTGPGTDPDNDRARRQVRSTSHRRCRVELAPPSGYRPAVGSNAADTGVAAVASPNFESPPSPPLSRPRTPPEQGFRPPATGLPGAARPTGHHSDGPCGRSQRMPGPISAYAELATRGPADLTRPGGCDPCGDERKGSIDRRGCACADGSRASCDGAGCSAGTYACSRALHLRFRTHIDHRQGTTSSPANLDLSTDTA